MRSRSSQSAASIVHDAARRNLCSSSSLYHDTVNLQVPFQWLTSNNCEVAEMMTNYEASWLESPISCVIDNNNDIMQAFEHEIERMSETKSPLFSQLKDQGSFEFHDFSFDSIPC